MMRREQRPLRLASGVALLFIAALSPSCGGNDSSADASEGTAGAPGVEPTEGDDAMPSQGDPAGDDDASPNEPGNEPGNEPAPTPDPSPEPGDDEGPGSAPTDSVTRVARLTHVQYRNTISDLFGIDDPPGDTFAPDAANGFEFDTSIHYRVDARLGPQYREAAEQLAARAATDGAVFDAIVPCDTAEASCRADFIASFGQRVFRRPLSGDEQTRFEAAFDSGADLVQSGDAFADGVQVVVEAMLQSPQFLYRVELSDEPGSDGIAWLDGWEIASRLSYFLWNTMPDEVLFAAAANGSLSDPAEIETQVTRMTSDPRATAKLVSFHEQAWQFSKLSRIAPDSESHPDAPEDLGVVAHEAARRFVEDVIDAGGGFRELMTASFAYADPGLAPLYEQDVSDGFQRIELDPSERRGFLTQVGFLAANAHSIKTDPIHRGLFVGRNLLCLSIPDPDADFTQLGLPETDEPPQTTRDEIALLTGTNQNPDPMREETCGACHSLINPAGFAFETFDAVGKLRQQENGVDVDTTGELFIDGELVAFEGALDLVDLVAASDAGNACYAGKLRNFALGHDLPPDDPELLAATLAATGTKDVARAIAVSASFRSRLPSEVAP